MISRRKTVLGLATAAGFASPALALTRTPRQSTGPFYPDVLPRESDADLVRIGSGPAAIGEEIEVAGQLLDAEGRPIANGFVELWQANANGRYSNSRDTSNVPLDPNFQGYGIVRTDEQGRYRFLTIKPGLYPGRTRHLHFRVGGPGFEPLPTQMYFAGDAGNTSDFLLNAVRDPQARSSLIVPFAAPLSGGVARGTFNIVVGV